MMKQTEMGSWRATLQDLRMSNLFVRAVYSTVTSGFEEVNQSVSV